jgi:hypothetical protein
MNPAHMTPAVMLAFADHIGATLDSLRGPLGRGRIDFIPAAETGPGRIVYGTLETFPGDDEFELRLRSRPFHVGRARDLRDGNTELLRSGDTFTGGAWVLPADTLLLASWRAPEVSR